VNIQKHRIHDTVKYQYIIVDVTMISSAEMGEGRRFKEENRN